jgi:hypothetical protein
MAMYGFRVYTLEPQVRRTKKMLKVEDVSEAGGATGALEAMHEQLLAIQGTTNVGQPTYFQNALVDASRQADIDKAEDVPYFTVLRVDKIGRTIKVLVETGREQDHDGLRTRAGKQEPIKKKAAVRTFSVAFIVPSNGDAALMVAEVRGRFSSVGEILLQWMTRSAQRANATVDAKGNTNEDAWLNWKPTARIDGDRLDGILNGSSEHKFTLKRQTVSAQGIRGGTEIELIQMGLRKASITDVGAVLMRMAGRKGKGTETARRKAAADDVLTLVEPNVGSVSFTDGELSFNENGKTQKITSETIDQLFVYPTGSKRPDADDLLTQSSKVVERVCKGLGIPTT